jgi:16S rRNA (adenine1518-N6/adenine1519-N6)-dimethyltransferase
MELDLNALVEEENGGRPIKVVANLPYYITTPIIMGLFESHVPLDSITVMVQKEVAARMKAGPGSKDYGALSLAVQYYAEPYIVANVPRNCFMPRPNVDSVVIRLSRYDRPPVSVQDEKLMFSLIRAAFEQRRKTLVNALAGSARLSISKEEAAAAIRKAGLPEMVRGEALELDQFARLADACKEIL